MVGDRQNDILGAKQNAMNAVGVSYGFGTIAELKKAGAVQIVQQPTELITSLPANLKF